MKTLNRALGIVAFLPMLLGSAALMAAPAYAEEICQTSPNVSCEETKPGQAGKPSTSSSPTATPSPSASSSSPTAIPSSPTPTPSSTTATPTPSLVAPVPGKGPEPSGTPSADTSSEDLSSDTSVSDQVGSAPVNPVPRPDVSRPGQVGIPVEVTEEAQAVEGCTREECESAQASDDQNDADQATSSEVTPNKIMALLAAAACLVLAGVILYLKIASDRRWKASQGKSNKIKTPEQNRL